MKMYALPKGRIRTINISLHGAFVEEGITRSGNWKE
jgi:hypothetical protein